MATHTQMRLDGCTCNLDDWENRWPTIDCGQEQAHMHGYWTKEQLWWEHDTPE